MFLSSQWSRFGDQSIDGLRAMAAVRIGLGSEERTQTRTTTKFTLKNFYKNENRTRSKSDDEHVRDKE